MVKIAGGADISLAKKANFPITGEGGGGSTGKYQLGERVRDDNNNEVGTVSGFFTDANDVEYAVVCLDAQYRLSTGSYCSNTSAVITDLPVYNDQSVWSATETATFNTQKILNFCEAQSATSTACSHCRSQTFTINGNTYSGQLPNIIELVDIFSQRIVINSEDTSASSYSSLVIPTQSKTWSSTQQSFAYGWFINAYGIVTSSPKKNENWFIIPVLELPNA